MRDHRCFLATRYLSVVYGDWRDIASPLYFWGQGRCLCYKVSGLTLPDHINFGDKVAFGAKRDWLDMA